MRKHANIYVDDALWLAFRKQCLEDHISASQRLTGLIETFLTDVSPPTPRPSYQRTPGDRPRLPTPSHA